MNNLIQSKMEEIFRFVFNKRTSRLSRGNVRMQRTAFSQDGDLDKARNNHIKRMNTLNAKLSR